MKLLKSSVSKSALLRFGLFTILGIVIFIVGLVRNHYIINLVESDRELFIPRSMVFTYKHSLFLNDPRWVSSLIYLLITFLLNLSIIYLAFSKKKFVGITIKIYAAFILLGAISIGWCYLLRPLQYSFQVASQINSLLQTPFISFFLVGLFYYLNRIDQ